MAQTATQSFGPRFAFRAGGPVRSGRQKTRARKRDSSTRRQQQRDPKPPGHELEGGRANTVGDAPPASKEGAPPITRSMERVERKSPVPPPIFKATIFFKTIHPILARALRGNSSTDKFRAQRRMT